MLRIIAPLLLVFSFSTALAQQAPPYPFTDCLNQVPYGSPNVRPNTTTICRKAYLLNHDPVAKIASWTAHTLTPQRAMGCLARDDAFAADQSIQKGLRSEPIDYKGSGYDQGHRGPWKQLETAVRAWSHEYKHSYTIYAGNIWYPTSKTIGPNKVVVPERLFKIIINNTSKQNLAFLMPNVAGVSSEIKPFQVSVAEIESITGLTFPVPDSKMMKNYIPPINFKKLTEDKKIMCKQ